MLYRPLFKPASARVLTLLWCASAILLFSVSALSEHVIQTGITHEKHARYVSVIIGRQQKRSQRMVADAFEILLYSDKTALADLGSIEPDWERAQKASYEGSDSGWNIQQGDISPRIIDEAYKSNIDYIILRNAFINILSNEPNASLSHDVLTVSQHERQYLATYGKVFADLGTLADQELDRIGWTELYILFPVTPIILLLNVIFIVIPTFRRINTHRKMLGEQHA